MRTRTIVLILVAVVAIAALLWWLIPQGTLSKEGSCYGVKVDAVTTNDAFKTTNTWADHANPARRIVQVAYWTYQQWSFYGSSGVLLTTTGTLADLKSTLAMFYASHDTRLSQADYSWFLCAVPIAGG